MRWPASGHVAGVEGRGGRWWERRRGGAGGRDGRGGAGGHALGGGRHAGGRRGGGAAGGSTKSPSLPLFTRYGTCESLCETFYGRRWGCLCGRYEDAGESLAVPLAGLTMTTPVGAVSLLAGVVVAFFFYIAHKYLGKNLVPVSDERRRCYASCPPWRRRFREVPMNR